MSCELLCSASQLPTQDESSAPEDAMQPSKLFPWLQEAFRRTATHFLSNSAKRFFFFNFTLTGLTCLGLSRTGGSAAARSRAAVNWCHKASAAVLVLIYGSPDSQMESRHDFLSRKLPASSWDVLKSGLGKCWREHFPAWASPCRATTGTGSSYTGIWLPLWCGK